MGCLWNHSIRSTDPEPHELEIQAFLLQLVETGKRSDSSYRLLLLDHSLCHPSFPNGNRSLAIACAEHVELDLHPDHPNLQLYAARAGSS